MSKFTRPSRRTSPLLATFLLLACLPFTASAADVGVGDPVDAPVGPTVTILAAPADPSSSSVAKFMLSSSQDAKQLECRLDARAPEACVSGVTYDGLDDGVHTLVVIGIDEFGNSGPPSSHTWMVDTTKPDTIIMLAPDPETASTTAQFSFTSNEQGTTFACTLDGQPVACSSPVDYTGLPDGLRSFMVAAIDRAGNRDEQPAAWTWIVDTTGPVVNLTQAGDVPRDAARGVFEFTSEPGTRFECQLDDREPAPCTSPVAWTGLTSGTHKVTVRGWDHLGNKGPAASVTWQVDTTPPDTTITSGPRAISGAATSFTFRSSKPGATFECALDGAAFAPCTSPTALAKLGGGVKRWRVRAVSPGGTVDPTPATRTWIVDSTGPIVTMHGGPADGSTTTATTATFLLRANEGGVTYLCALDAGKPASCSARERRTGLSIGAHVFRVVAIDRFGNEGPPATRRWTIAPSRR